MVNNSKSLVADKLVITSATKHNNYWSPLACLVEEQEENDDDHLHVDHLLSITTDMSNLPVKKKITEKWKRKIANRSGILDTGCTSGAGAEMDMEFFHDTGLPVQEGIHVTGHTENTGNKNHAPEAQSLSWCRRDEHSAKFALYTYKCVKDG